MKTADVVVRLRAAGCVFAEEEERLLRAEAQTPSDFDALVERRIAGVPLEHILGWVGFCGLQIAVAPNVFVPRQRTEFLVRRATALAKKSSAPAVVIDLCCGSGAIGLALAAGVESVKLHSVDLDPGAVACARRNLADTDARVYEGDLFTPLPVALRGRVDIVVANVPYVPTDEIAFLPPEAREHEPLSTLDGGDDGLDILRRVVADASEWLAPGGHLLIETSTRQAPLAVDAFTLGGFDACVASSKRFAATIVIGTVPVVPGTVPVFAESPPILNG